MAIVKRNNYIEKQNITNLALNVDLNRVTDDKSFISVNFGTTPATVTIKEGSLIEVNGNLYNVTLDETFQMSDSGHNYIVFDGTTFSSASTIGTERADKGGWYQADNISRTLKWNIDQTNEIFGTLNFRDNYKYGFLRSKEYIEADKNSCVLVTMSAPQGIGTSYVVVNLDTVNKDINSEWNPTTKRFTPLYNGTYNIDVDLHLNPTSSYVLVGVLRKNGSVVKSCYAAITSTPRTEHMSWTIDLTTSDYIDVAARSTNAGALPTVEARNLLDNQPTSSIRITRKV